MDNAVSIDITNNNDDEETKSLRKQILDTYEITRRGDDCMLCDVVYEMLNNSKKKINAELESMGVMKRKSKRRDETREKMCYFGLKKLIQPEDEKPDDENV